MPDRDCPAHGDGFAVDPRLDGHLLGIHRHGETADPHLDAVAVGRNLAYYPDARHIRLTKAGRDRLRAANLL